jgi:hypothetical protein
MVSATTLYWEFRNVQYRHHGLSRLYDNGFFSEGLGFLIPCISRTPILEGKFLSKSAAYTRANTAMKIRLVVLEFVHANGRTDKQT